MRQALVVHAVSGDLSRFLMDTSAKLEENKQMLVQTQCAFVEAAKLGELPRMLQDASLDAPAVEDHASKVKFARLEHETQELRVAAAERARLFAELARLQALIEVKNMQNLKRRH